MFWTEKQKEKKSQLCKIFPSSVYDDKFENHFPAG